MVIWMTYTNISLFFVFQGHDTTAMAICFALLLLAENKEIQVFMSLITRA